MKKLILTLLLLLGPVSALFAQQDVQNDILSYLKHEGYLPTLDEDGDIQFKMEGIGYFVLTKEVDDADYAYVEVLASFNTDDAYDKLLKIASEMNQDKFVCKCSVLQNDGKNIFLVSMEFITNSRANTQYQLSHALRLLPGWVKAFKDKLNE